MAQTKADILRALLQRRQALTVPGIHDALSARLVEAAGFEAAFVSGAGVSMSRLGMADLAYLNLSDLADCVRSMAVVSGIPLIVDIDTGFGNAHNVAQTLRVLQRAGAAAVQIEDQAFPKKCGQIGGKEIVACAEMVGKIRAACGARGLCSTLVIARTDAPAIMPFGDVLGRCDAYIDAGADALFVQPLKSESDMVSLAKHINGRVPLVHNFVEGGSSPIADMTQLEALGFKIGLFPLVSLNASIPALLNLLTHLRENGQSKSWDGALATVHDLNAIVGLDDLMAISEKFIEFNEF